MELYEGEVVSTVTYRAEMCRLKTGERHTSNDIGINSLRSMCGVTRMIRWVKAEISIIDIKLKY